MCLQDAQECFESILKVLSFNKLNEMFAATGGDRVPDDILQHISEMMAEISGHPSVNTDPDTPMN